MDTGLKLYGKLRPLIQTGDLIEWQSDSALGRIIRWKTGKDVNHTSVALVYTLSGGTRRSEPRYCVCESLGNGVSPYFLSSRLSNFEGKVFCLKLKSGFADKRLDFAEAAIRLEGAKYDYKSLFRNLHRQVPVDRTKLFCSEMAQAALIDCGLLSSDYNQGYALVPGDFDKTGIFSTRFRIF